MPCRRQSSSAHRRRTRRIDSGQWRRRALPSELEEGPACSFIGLARGRVASFFEAGTPPARCSASGPRLPLVLGHGEQMMVFPLSGDLEIARRFPLLAKAELGKHAK